MFWNDFLDLIFPSVCLGCQTPLPHAEPLCADCFAALPRADALFCGRCLARRPDGRTLCHPDHPYRFGAASDYRDPMVRALIHDLKFRSRREAAHPLAELLIEYADRLSLDLKSYLIMPIPLAAHRARQRGFNQAALIAEPLARHFGKGLSEEILVRTRSTKPQSELKDFAERRQNVTACFAVRELAAVAGQAVLLVDDVRTSGATLEEAARALKKAGARRVLALVAARA
ncbi:MAG TPA: ComF family protein [Candidatus Paceibacterota bacterium]|nr:ComF family protein [Candidatus Paceibacterota bacterium]